MVETAIAIPDIHVGFECRKYLGIVEYAIKSLKPKFVIQMGDFADCPQISDYDKDPTRKDRLWDDIQTYNDLLDDWEALMPRGSVFHQLEGNHEDRLRRYIGRNAPHAQELVREWPELLRFSDRNADKRVKFFWHRLAKWNSCRIHDTVFHHGKFFDKNVAVTNLTRYPGINIVTGHTHRVQYATNGAHWSATIGHGSDAEQTMHEPVPTVWQQAIAIITFVNGRGTIDIVNVEDGRCVLRGKPMRATA